MGKVIFDGLTFDDVLLVPQYSEVIPSQVNLRTKLTNNIILNIPIVSAAMDTVTEYEMAIAMARVGGLGFIHKNMSIEEQAEQVNRVKVSESGMITKPITLKSDSFLYEANEIMRKYKISGLPVINDENELLGIVTNRDLKYREDLNVRVDSVMTKDNLVTASVGISLDEAKKILLEHRIEKLPIVEGKILKGLITIKDIDNLIEYPNACKDDKGRLRVGAAVGIGEDTLDRVDALVKAGVDVITIDSAHGHSYSVLEIIKKIRAKYPDLDLIGGNIVTKDAAKALKEAGVNTVKVGIGPGSICTTRVVAGVGMPQLSAVMEVYEYCRDNDICVIADGGIKLSGDIVKALAAGADCVMLGSLLAGTYESPGEEIISNGRRYKSYVGMGSLAAMKRGSSDRYFQKKVSVSKFVPEGIESMVPVKGSLADSVYQLCGGISAGMGYCGCPTIADLKENSQFVKITNAGLKESHPHDVIITKEAPNYTGEVR